jgi:ubiquinone/menaquinone biosynthesis C-methylase UbiE
MNETPKMDRAIVSRVAVVLTASAGVFVSAAAFAWTQSTKPRTKADPKINEPFKRPDLKGYIKKFESDDREIYAKREEIVAALGLKPGMAVADVGAGTGLFTRIFADRVGATGKVYAVDIAQRFLTHIAAEARKRGHSQIMIVRGDQESTHLPSESVDLVFLCDVYHHLENPEKVLASIRRALKPEGNLVVIDFDRVERRSTEFVLKHVRASQDVFRREIEASGFRLVPSRKAPPLKETFFLRFEKSTPPSTR